VKFVLRFWFVSVMNIMRGDCRYQCNVTGTGTVHGMDPTHIYYKESYFHYECGKLECGNSIMLEN
jgi:hypothetical protein